jgi:hypothetical protein
MGSVAAIAEAPRRGARRRTWATPWVGRSEAYRRGKACRGHVRLPRCGAVWRTPRRVLAIADPGHGSGEFGLAGAGGAGPRPTGPGLRRP